MDYERIHNLQSGIISPSKLRMKLMGPHHSQKKNGSNNNSARTSPSRLDDTEFVKNSLLESNDSEAPSIEALSVSILGGNAAFYPGQDHLMAFQMNELHVKEKGIASHAGIQQFSKGENPNSSAVHPMRSLEDENLDYDSNASSSSFEFHKDRTPNNQSTRSYSRPMPSKWNDAEKWIMNRQIMQPHCSKKSSFYNQASRMPNMGRSASDTPSISAQACGGNTLADQCQRKVLSEVNGIKNSADGTTSVPFVRSVCMRDMGTEMTPVTSQEPSRTATPVDATTPFRSPASSFPSTPCRGELTAACNDDRQLASRNGKQELSELDLKVKTRREIVALGVQLGKMSIAAWASKADRESTASSLKTTETEELQTIEYEKRAAAWQEAEQSKHAARFKREEIKIQAWESQQRAKLEVEMRRTEARVEQMKAQAEAKMVKKIAMARQRSEEKRAAAEARKSREAERTAAEVEYIRQTGRMPPSWHYLCCGWL